MAHRSIACRPRVRCFFPSPSKFVHFELLPEHFVSAYPNSLRFFSPNISRAVIFWFTRIKRASEIKDEDKERLKKIRLELDPLQLVQDIRIAQAHLANFETQTKDAEISSQTLDRFMEELPHLWKNGEVRATHRKPDKPPRHWRTRADPFRDARQILKRWLEKDPDTTAKELLERLCVLYPEKYSLSQLRTLQRRVIEWRQRKAENLLFLSEKQAIETNRMF